MDSFGLRLKAIRESKRISQEELSQISRISQTNISKLERCVSSPSLSTTQQLADALGVQLSDLLGPSFEVCSYSLTNRERVMFDCYRRLSLQQQEFIYDAIVCAAEKKGG